MPSPIFNIKEVTLHWGAAPVLDGLDLNIESEDRLCLLGRNGSGKSTLLKVVAGLIEPDGGSRWVQPGITIAYLEQDPDASAFADLHAYVMDGLPEPEKDQSYRVDTLLMDLGLTGNQTPQTASGGELRRAALARALVGEPDLLLLDEPTNHLDITTIAWLEQYLQTWRGAFVVISHDRAFLKRLTTGCLWLDRGQVRVLDAGFEAFAAWQNDVLENEREARHKLNRLIKEEARWSVEGISARRKRNMGRMRRLEDLRQERKNQLRETGSVQFQVEGGESSGVRVFEAKNITKAYEGKKLFENFSIRINRGDKIGLIGPNGVGKSTLLKILMGEIEADSGTVVRGSNLQTILFDQKRTFLDPEATVKDTLTGGRGDYVGEGENKRHFASYMKDFLFDPSQAKQPVSALSGGERNRLLLATYFSKPSNVLVLDEPTNDLDMDTLDLLQEVLCDYAGTVLLVSHDRDFLDRIVTSSVVMEGDGTAIEYAGGWSDYRAQKKQHANMLRDEQAAKKVVSLQTAKTKEKKAKKLSYNDQRDLDALPARIEAVQTEIIQLEATLADPDFYGKDPEGFHAMNRALTEATTNLEAMEIRWLELEELKDSLEG